MKRVLRSDDGTWQVYEIVTDDGKVVGRDELPVPTTEDTNESTVRTRATAALDDLRALASGTGTMTGAQLSAAVRLLARVAIVLLRMALRRFDATD